LSLDQVHSVQGRLLLPERSVSSDFVPSILQTMSVIPLAEQQRDAPWNDSLYLGSEY
jgi:hypothetical protein